jgi:hypothetical protein
VRRSHRTKARLRDACIDATTYDAGFQAVEAVEVIAQLGNGENPNGEKFLVPGRVAMPQNTETWTTSGPVITETES